MYDIVWLSCIQNVSVIISFIIVLAAIATGPSLLCMPYQLQQVCPYWHVSATTSVGRSLPAYCLLCPVLAATTTGPYLLFMPYQPQQVLPYCHMPVATGWSLLCALYLIICLMQLQQQIYSYSLPTTDIFQLMATGNTTCPWHNATIKLLEHIGAFLMLLKLLIQQGPWQTYMPYMYCS